MDSSTVSSNINSSTASYAITNLAINNSQDIKAKFPKRSGPKYERDIEVAIKVGNLYRF